MATPAPEQDPKADLPLTPATNSRRIIRSLKRKADEKRTASERAADWITDSAGSMVFFVANALWFFFWIPINLGFIPGITPFDPFPFGLLTMIVSLEAIFLSIIVLISQNRGSKIDDLREEIDLQVDIITEQEVTKLLPLVSQIAEKNGITVDSDKVLQSMIRPTNMEKIEKSLQQQIVERK